MRLIAARDIEIRMQELLLLSVHCKNTFVSCLMQGFEDVSLLLNPDDPHIACAVAREHLQAYNEREELRVKPHGLPYLILIRR